jgi:hypothetical protein
MKTPLPLKVFALLGYVMLCMALLLGTQQPEAQPDALPTPGAASAP